MRFVDKYISLGVVLCITVPVLTLSGSSPFLSDGQFTIIASFSLAAVVLTLMDKGK